MFERGVIRNEDIARILRDFSGLQFERGITPTDLDGFVEFADDVYVFIETKYGDSPLQGGQRLALERLADRVGETRHSILIVAKHNVAPSTDEKIDVSNCIVTEYRSRATWRVPEKHRTVRQLIDSYRDWAAREFTDD